MYCRFYRQRDLLLIQGGTQNQFILGKKKRSSWPQFRTSFFLRERLTEEYFCTSSFLHFAFNFSLFFPRKLESLWPYRIFRKIAQFKVAKLRNENPNQKSPEAKKLIAEILAKGSTAGLSVSKSSASSSGSEFSIYVPSTSGDRSLLSEFAEDMVVGLMYLSLEFDFHRYSFFKKLFAACYTKKI
jgi:hypothetical protein